jgi:hypothetical protein
VASSTEVIRMPAAARYYTSTAAGGGDLTRLAR